MSAECYTPLALMRYYVNPEALAPGCWLALREPQSAPDLDVGTWVFVFALTCALEAPFYLLATRGLAWKKRIVALLACNLATHPLVCFGIPRAVAQAGGDVARMLTIGEIMAPLVEALLLWLAFRTRPLTAFVLMIAGNLFSWWVGLYLVA